MKKALCLFAFAAVCLFSPAYAGGNDGELPPGAPDPLMEQSYNYNTPSHTATPEEVAAAYGQEYTTYAASNTAEQGTHDYTPWYIIFFGVTVLVMFLANDAKQVEEWKKQRALDVANAQT